MADYNIYIHSDGFGNNRKPTQPWEEDDASNFSDNAARFVQKAANTAQSPDSLMSGAMGKVMKAVPWLAAAYLVLKLTDSVITTANSFITTETGDYRFQTEYNNFRNTLKAAFQPFQTTVSIFQTKQRIRIENQKSDLNRMLYSDSIVNGNTFYGV